MKTAFLLAVATLAGAAIASNALAQAPMRVVGQAANAAKHVEVEKKFFASLQAEAGLPAPVSYNVSDVLNVKPADALRLVRTGAFDVMSTQIGQAARDDAFFEGIDLVGVATDVPALRKSVEAYRDVFDKRLQAKFNAKVMTLWPFGPQVIYCNGPIAGVQDLKNKKVRVFTASMAALVNHLGGTAVTMPAQEVYSALQRGIVECAVTSPTSGNTSRWPELTDHFFPLALAGSMQGHFINLDTWKKLTPDQQAKMTAAFKKLEDEMWALADSSNADAYNCNIGQQPCTGHTAYKMKLVPVTPADVAAVHKASTDVVLPLFKTDCLRVEPNCPAIWNDTVGRAQKMKIP